MSWSLHLNNIASILATRNLKVYGRHAGLKDILVWKHLMGFMKTWPLTLMPWLTHMFIQRLMKVVGIGIVTPRLYGSWFEK